MTLNTLHLYEVFVVCVHRSHDLSQPQQQLGQVLQLPTFRDLTHADQDLTFIELPDFL